MLNSYVHHKCYVTNDKVIMLFTYVNTLIIEQLC